jgi:hypothetical protein
MYRSRRVETLLKHDMTPINVTNLQQRHFVINITYYT